MMQKVVDRLSPEDRIKYRAHLSAWRALELSTYPTHRDRAEKFILDAYWRENFAAPAIHWCKSPMEMAL